MEPINLKSKLGWLSVIYLSILPVLVWYFSIPGGVSFSTFTVASASLGKITGIIGMAMFSLVLVLATRHSFLEDYFGGIDKLYKAHRIFGSAAFILILFHPLALAARYIPFSLSEAAASLLPGSDWLVNAGIIALFLMMLFLVLTIFVKLPYQKWKSTHKFLGMAFFLASLHTFFVPSDVSRILILKIYMGSLVAAGLAAFCYRVLFNKMLVKRHEYIVESVKSLNDITEISMIPRNEPIKFMSGQFVFISFHNGGVSTEVHPFSISSSPSENRLRLSIKPLGDYTSQLKNLRKGATAKIEGPFGKFSYMNYNSKNQIWVAGGIGITPFLSMARSLSDDNYMIEMYYCVKNKSEAIYLDELIEASSRNRSFRVVPFYSSEHGRINAEIIGRLSNGLSDKSILLCGPQVMMKGLKDQFMKLGVHRNNIHYEEFQLL